MPMLLDRFKNFKTMTKLMVGFSIIGVVIAIVGLLGVFGLQQVREKLRVVYDNSTQNLAALASAASSLGLYHDSLLEASRARTKVEFDVVVKPLDTRKSGTLEPITGLAGGQLRVSKSGRDESRDLAALQGALNAYFKAADGVLSTVQDSLNPKFSEEQRELFKELAATSVATDVTSRYSDATKKLGEMVTSAREVAKDLNDEGQAVAQKQTINVIGGAFLAIVLGVSFGYLVARFLAKGVTQWPRRSIPCSTGSPAWSRAKPNANRCRSARWSSSSWCRKSAKGT